MLKKESGRILTPKELERLIIFFELLDEDARTQDAEDKKLGIKKEAGQ